MKRLKHYINFEIEVIPDIKKGKNMGIENQKKFEGELILSKVAPGKELHLFDENGTIYSSKEFAGFLGTKDGWRLKRTFTGYWWALWFFG